MWSKIKWIIPLIAVVALAAIACSAESTTDGLKEQRAVQERAQVLNQDRAISAVPIPQPDQFMTRTQVARWMSEMDKPAQTWYMYAFMEGFAEPIALFIADAPATPYCAFLTPPEQTNKFDGGTDGATNPINVQAPGLDGVYWGSGDCYSYQYFWDESTGLMVQVQDFKLMMANGRLSFLDVPEIKVSLVQPSGEE